MTQLMIIKRISLLGPEFSSTLQAHINTSKKQESRSKKQCIEMIGFQKTNARAMLSVRYSTFDPVQH